MKTAKCLLIGALALGVSGALEAQVDRGGEVVTAPRTERRAPGQTDIYANESATFDSERKVAVFRGEVRVEDDRFVLTSDQLTVYLDDAEGGLDRAEAEGNVVITQRQAEDGQERSRGFAERAIYHADTGEVVLQGWPRVQQGFNLHIATEAGTRMRLTEDGRLHTDGKSRTEITERE